MIGLKSYSAILYCEINDDTTSNTNDRSKDDTTSNTNDRSKNFVDDVYAGSACILG